MAELDVKPQDTKPLTPEAEELARLNEIGAKLDKIFGPRVGGIRRPWAKIIPRINHQTTKLESVTHLWEMGAKTTLEIKEEIQTLLEHGHSLVEILDSKSMERPDVFHWWPSLMEIISWCQFDQGFAQMLDTWNHARQMTLLEGVTFNVMNPLESGLDPKVLKVQADFAAKVLPRIVHKGMAEHVEVNATVQHRGPQAYQKMSDDAIKARLAELGMNPKVKRVLTESLEGEPVPSRSIDPDKPMCPGQEIIDIDLEIPE
jgi:hypothetical protein